MAAFISTYIDKRRQCKVNHVHGEENTRISHTNLPPKSEPIHKLSDGRLRLLRRNLSRVVGALLCPDTLGVVLSALVGPILDTMRRGFYD